MHNYYNPRELPGYDHATVSDWQSSEYVAEVVRPIIGYREWVLVGDEILSPLARTPWDAGPMQAECLPSCREAQGLWRTAAAHSGPPPAPGCVCGIYALFAPGRSRGRERMAIVRGAVVLWGRIELHRRGMRAEFARIVTLALPSSHGHTDAVFRVARLLDVEAVRGARPAAGGAGLRRGAGPHFHPELRRSHDRTVRRHEEGARDLRRRSGHRADAADRHAGHGPVERQQRHRTDYAGTVWYGGLPQIVGGTAPRPERRDRGSFWLPDSHSYEPGAAGDIQIQGAAIQGSRATSAGGNFTILEVAAALGQDPGNSGAALLYLAVKAIATLPLGVAYRAVVICAPEAVRPPAA